MSTSNVPGVFSTPRIITLLAALLCTLSSGTNYVYSAYAPQLGSRLHINHTILNIVGLGGNVGVYLSGPFWGRYIDKRGPRIPLLAACVLLLVGYSGIRAIYLGGVPEGVTSLPAYKLVALVTFSFMTGVGGNGGMTAGINTTTKTFPDHVRGSTTGVVISGFGLSAFFFSTLSHVFTAGDTASFLLLLSLGTSLPMIVGFFFCKPIPLEPSQQHHHEREGEEVDYAEIDAASLTPSVLFHHDNDSRTQLLSPDGDRDDEEAEEGRASMELGPAPGLSPGNRPPSRHHQHRGRSPRNSARPIISVEAGPNVFGKELMKSGNFWILTCVLALLSGTGLMYINNVGSMSQALYVHEAQSSTLSDADRVEIAKWQAAQVSTISFMNFSGRIFIGLLSDVVKARLGKPRSYLLVLVSFLVLVSQLAASNIDKLVDLWKASALLGLGYGSVFSLFAALCVEWFGVAHFSENWGYVSLAPMVGGNVFSVAFGRNLDAHEKAAISEPSPETFAPKPAKEIQCLEGKACYVDSIHLTTLACLVAMALSVWAAWRDRKQREEETQKAGDARADIIWEGDE